MKLDIEGPEIEVCVTVEKETPEVVHTEVTHGRSVVNEFRPSGKYRSGVRNTVPTVRHGIDCLSGAVKVLGCVGHRTGVDPLRISKFGHYFPVSIQRAHVSKGL